MVFEKCGDCAWITVSLRSMASQRLRMACRSIRRVNRCATTALLLALLALSLLAAALFRRLARCMSEVGIPSSIRMSLGAHRHARRNGHLPVHPDGPPHAIANQGNKIGPEVRVLQSQASWGEFESRRTAALATTDCALPGTFRV